MDPASMATIGIGASAVGAGVGAIGNLENAQAQKEALQYQAALAQQQAAIDLQLSTREIMAGGVEAIKAGFQTATVRGAQRAGFGAGNIMGATPGRVMASTTQQGQWQQQIIASNAMGRAYRLQVDAAGQQGKAALATLGASQAQIAGDIGATSSILGGVASVGTKVAQYGTQFGGTPGSSFFNAPA